MINLFLALQAAYSAEPIKVLPQHMQQGDVDTAWGVIPKSLAWGLCMSPEVKVVTVKATRAFPKEFRNPSGIHVRTVEHAQLEDPVLILCLLSQGPSAGVLRL